MNIQQTVSYIIDLLAGFSIAEAGTIHYGIEETASSNSKIIIIPVVTDFEIMVLPLIPFVKIDDTPILFGKSIIERKNDKLIIYADIIASSFFLLSRYEELLNTARDQHGRFTAKESIVFQQGYGNRPLVDEYGVLLREWLREVGGGGANIPPEKYGFSKIYLTHDVDEPFRFERFARVCKQIIKNILRYHQESNPLKKYISEKYDDNYTFPKIINYDSGLKEKMPDISIESIYFLICAGSLINRRYYNFSSNKIKRLITVLENSGAMLGLHVSYEAGKNPEQIIDEADKLKKILKTKKISSRHHFLLWREPENVDYMEKSGITDDFTLSYADSIGFRVGTCRPYRFINPRTKELTNLIIHPLEIMECTLNRHGYMELDYEHALESCKEIISQVNKHNGELVLLWHNSEFTGKNYQEDLYKAVLEYIYMVYISTVNSELPSANLNSF